MSEMAWTRWGRPRRLLCLAAAAGLACLAVAVSPSFAATERVQDGGFEAATCDASDCSDPAWVQGVTGAFASSTGPICRSGTGSGETACTGGGSIPAAGVTWARLGAGYKGAAIDGGVIDWLEQPVPIPAGHSAILSFRLRIIDVAGPTGRVTVSAGEMLKVQNGEAPVFTATDTTPGFASYATVTVDLSSLAGTTPLIRFEGVSSQVPIGQLDSFDVDSISLATTDPRCAPLRKKLKKAKAKKQKSKVRKIRKKMRALGC